MAWPPPTLPTNRTDATPQQTTHAGDHNAANQAINDIVTRIQGRLTIDSKTFTGPGGSYPDGSTFMTMPIAAAAVARYMTFTYNGLVTNQAGMPLNINALWNGAIITSFRHPGNGATSMVNLSYQGVGIPANTAGTLTMQAVGSAVTLYADQTLHNVTLLLNPA